MKSAFAIGPVALTSLVQAFPTPENLANLAGHDGELPDSFLEKIAEINDNQKRSLFDPLAEPIQIHGAHEFRAPNFAKGDTRGPCPGLNALANHGYLPRSGVAGFFEVIEGINSVFGMGVDLATILSTMGTVGVGNPLSLKPGFSIGGESRKSQNPLGNLLGLLGTPQGLDGSHNWIEADSSNTRDDLYVTGDASTMNMELWTQVYESILKNGPMDIDMMGDRAAERYHKSVATNPQFWYGPYTGFIVRNAGFAFSARLLSNHSAENPYGGDLNKETLKAFWGVCEDDSGYFEYKKGWERIPENWYRYNGQYGLVNLNLDLVRFITHHPELANIGGNLGGVNRFAGVDLEDLTGGVLNAASLLEGNNLLCFSLELVKTFAPNSLSGLFRTLAKPLKLVNDALLDPLLDLNCPAFDALSKGGDDIIEGLMEKFPGAKKSGFAL
ncbi:Aromatic peroxygenase-like protein [Emericellopsis cladophorae]|uniref:Aromatic peroxygenase-like protein n=1 Tax=Emericellopsis cladophorae TaxID=2686198 RepID=A0A9Q0BBD0_9HYPO|nr:Aromatic peroxygenase-like protein [Emericellopsis cladophorae]KAI6778370.1 Aromatic peroxygenase-like protein [Emericellopsis cladophorae]